MIYLEKNVPPVYVDESRDFQFILRAYNVILNMVKQDTDSLRYLSSTKHCDNSVLPLLATKLGFFTNYSVDNIMMRGILTGFPEMIKNKGSIKSIQQAISIFLKVLGIKTSVVIKLINNTDSGDDYKVLIGIESSLKNYHILDELFRYIMPVGYNYEVYFYSELKKDSYLFDSSKGKFIVISNLLSDSIRYEGPYTEDEVYSNSDVDRLINQVSTTNIFSSEDLEPISSGEPDVMELTTSEPYKFTENYYFFYIKTGGKYVQLTEAPSGGWEEDTYYIPRFFFEDQFDNYQLLESDPTIEISGETKSLLDICYYNYYIKDGDVYKNLQGPVTFAANTYYSIIPSGRRVLINNSDVESTLSIPINSEYLYTASTT